MPATTAPITGVVMGTVTSSLGGVFSSVDVRLTPANGIVAEMLTTIDGTYAFKNVPAGSGAGSVVVSRVPSNCIPATASYAGLAGGTTKTVDVTVSCAAMGSVAGTVISTLGGGISGAAVTVTPASGAALPTVKSSSSGAFVVAGVPVGLGQGAGGGTVTVTGMAGNCASGKASYAGLTDSSTVTANVVVSCAPAGTVAGTVTSSRGGGIFAASVVVTPVGGTAMPAVATTASGLFSVSAVPVGGGPEAGSGTVTVTGVPINCTGATVGYSGLANGLPASVNVVVPCGPPPNLVTTCQRIAAPGWYVLAGNIGSNTPGSSCIVISGNDVALDCVGHTIAFAGPQGAAIEIPAVQDVSVSNCVINATGISQSAAIDINGAEGVTITNLAITMKGANAYGIFVDAAKNVSVANCTFNVTPVGGPARDLYVLHAQGAQITGNQLTAYVQDSSSFVTVANNVITSRGGESGIFIEGGNHNVIRRNRVDGSTRRADDGIAVGNEDADTLQDNTLTSFFDAGIESFGLLTNTVMVGNTIADVGVAGVGSYWGTSWVSNQIFGNHVSNTMKLVLVFYGGNSRLVDTVTTIDFLDNSIRGNVFDDPPPAPPGSTNLASIFIMMAGPFSLPSNIGGNTVAMNTLTKTIAAFLLTPPSAFIDGGGNICDPANPGNFGSCSGGAAAMASASRVPRTQVPAPPHPMPRIPMRPRHATPPAQLH